MSDITKVTVGFPNDRLAIEIDGQRHQLINYRRHGMLPFNGLSKRVELIELLECCLAFYAADRITLRPKRRWTRAFEITFPVWRIAEWRAIRHDLEELFWLSTGDEVTLRPIERSVSLLHRDSREEHFLLEHLRPLEVWLLSDGLDSLCGSCKAITAPGESAAFLSVITKRRAISRLRQIRQGLVEKYGTAASFYHLGLELSAAPEYEERTQRSRGIVAIASGLTVAAAHSANVVNVAENGIGILNLPIASLQSRHESSQVLHPGNLDLWARVSAALLGGARLSYPNRFLTKAQMIRRLPAWGRDLIQWTSSCDSPQRTDSSEDCGVCFSCTYRKLSLSMANCTHPDTRYTAKPPRRDGHAPIDAMLLQAEKLESALSSRDPWSALTRLQPTLAASVDENANAADRAHLILSTIALFTEHVREFRLVRALPRAV
jgi:hypothetical protein